MRNRNLLSTAAILLLLLTTSCVMWNRGTLVLARHISIGQEFIDLQEARDRGAISEEEYEDLRGKLMEQVDSLDTVEVVDGRIPDQFHGQHDD